MSFSEIILLIVTLSYGIFPFMSIFSPNYFDNSLKVEADFINTDQYYNDIFIPELNKIENVNYKNKIEKGVGLYFNTNFTLSKKFDLYSKPGIFIASKDYFSTLNLWNLNLRYKVDEFNGLSCGVMIPFPATQHSSGDKYKTTQIEINYDRKLNDSFKIVLGIKKPLEKYYYQLGKLTYMDYKFAIKLGFECNF
ncbi:MAG: hypothetical protein N2321_04215 [Melioribacteraceae bacterium]|nr:hypothetical protein [Melioribacteraceae bacterium]